MRLEAMYANRIDWTGYDRAMAEKAVSKTAETFARKRQSLRAATLEILEANEIDVSDFGASMEFLKENGIEDATARRILEGTSSGNKKTWAVINRLRGETIGRSPEAAQFAVLAAMQAKKSTPESLAALVEELSRDPSDRKLVEMMLLMFRDS